MRFLLILITLSGLVTACKSGEKDQKQPVASAEGSWLVLYSRLDPKSADVRNLYKEITDSLLSLHGLKLLRFGDDGKIYQADSILSKPGSWALTSDGILMIRDAGLGMERLMGQDVQMKDDKMQVGYPVKYKGELMKVNWYYKKLDEKDAVLLDKEQNSWRQPLPADATEEQVAAKVVKMLNYYGHYFHLLARESTYFYPDRMALPFKYYQHAVGLRPFSMDTRFAGQFTDSLQALQAWDVLNYGFKRLSDSPFPKVENNYTEEYALFIEQLAGNINDFYSK